MRTILADIFRGLFLLFLKNKIIRLSSFKPKAIPFTGDVVAHWYSAPDFWGRGSGFESDIPTMILMRCRIIMIKQKFSGQRGKPTPEAKKRRKKEIVFTISIADMNYRIGSNNLLLILFKAKYGFYRQICDKSLEISEYILNTLKLFKPCVGAD